MSELTATQVPKPANEQDFESASVVLWRCILKDPNVKTLGRRGQKQFGVDLTGIRDNQPDAIVGIQCKLKSDGNALEEQEVRDEVAKALTFVPALSEYFIITTAPDDQNMDRLAHQLSIDASTGRARPLTIRIYGWGTLSREIRRYVDATNAFDPSHTPHGDVMLQVLNALREDVGALRAENQAGVRVEARAVTHVDSGQDSADPVDPEITGYAELISTDPATALRLLDGLNRRLPQSASNRTRFRVAANIAACKLELGEEDVAADALISAYQLDPTNPKAAANKALALLLKRDGPTLRTFAEATLPLMPDNEALASYYIQGITNDLTIIDPLLMVPEPLRTAPAVTVAMVRWTLERGSREDWRAAAIAAHTRYPDDAVLKVYYANALLDRVNTRGGFLYGRIYSQDEQADVREAIAIMAEEWKAEQERRVHPSRKSTALPLNLLVGLRILHETQQAVVVAEEALKLFPADPEVQQRSAATLLEAGRSDLARELVTRLPVNDETIMMRFGLAMNMQDWPSVFDLVNQHLSTFPPYEQGVAQAGAIVAQVHMSPAEDRAGLLQDALPKLHTDCRALVILAEAARNVGVDAISDTLFEAAQSAATSSDVSFAARVSLADEAMDRGKPQIAADILWGHVDLNRNSPELKLLAAALAYHVPIRERAKAFFDGLAADIRATPTFRRYESIYHLNRGVPHDAIPLLESLFAEDPQFQHLMALTGVYLQTGNDEKVAGLVAEVSNDALSGDAEDRINYAHILQRFGEPDRAIALGYKAVIDGLDRSEVVMRYFGLFLPPDPVEPALPTSVQPGTWVSLVSELGTTYEALVGETADRAWGTKVEVHNAFIQKAIGLQVGQAFVFETAVGVSEIWTVSEIKPRWLQAYQVLSHTFALRFPEASGFFLMTMRDGDIQPTLDHVRRYSEAVRERADLYLNAKVPLAFMAGDRAGGAIGFAEYLNKIGENVRTCVGTADEREQAFAMIVANAKRGAVLDAFTAWRAAELGVFDLLEAELGTLTLPAPELAVLKALLDEMDDDFSTERMTLSYVNGQYYRDIHSPEEQAANFQVLKDRVEIIEAACLSESFLVPDEISREGAAMFALPGGIAMAPGALAGRARLFLTDDAMMREFANVGFGTNGVWLQAVLLHGFNKGTLPLDRYADALVLLSAYRHSFVAINLEVMHSVFNRDHSPALSRLRALCTFLGGQEADPITHMAAACDFINQIWRRSPEWDIRVARATGIVLEAILGRHRGENWVIWAARLTLGLCLPARAYLSNWCAGHFLPFEDVKGYLQARAAMMAADAAPKP